jgi:hypothetical protein
MSGVTALAATPDEPAPTPASVYDVSRDLALALSAAVLELTSACVAEESHICRGPITDGGAGRDVWVAECQRHRDARRAATQAVHDLIFGLRTVTA